MDVALRCQFGEIPLKRTANLEKLKEELALQSFWDLFIKAQQDLDMYGLNCLEEESCHCGMMIMRLMFPR